MRRSSTKKPREKHLAVIKKHADMITSNFSNTDLVIVYLTVVNA